MFHIKLSLDFTRKTSYSKNMKEYIKSATEMDFQEFERWAREYLVGQFLDNGLQGMKGGLYVILSQVALNEVWGGNQKQKK